ncbi:ATP-dependent Zn protease [Rhizobium ruizarguesonis]|uniref:ATP-dependent Zn protease n=1 Tax=Rhizobium ruizarguesonis TaxID=2081791 RepID=UPI001032349E|nr:ATP-dependent Zn protease [Rhizobium ruizarguesonis]TBA22789.1 ATP-dependent Zn protease [Rhizobium ruizarguesonis]
MTEPQNTNASEMLAAVQEGNSADAILRRLATRAMGLTGADIERIVREARLKARRGKRAIRYEDIEEGIRGHRPPVPYNLRWRFAFHEAGHAVVHHTLDLGPVRGLNIDTGQGGYNLVGFHVWATDTGDWYENMLAMLMAGRAAEQLVLKRVSSGSAGADDSDLARATRLAFDMERTLGFGTEHPLLYRPHRDPSAVLDREAELAARVHARLVAALERAVAILKRRRSTFHALAKALFDAQAMDETAVNEILKDVEPLHGSGRDEVVTQATPILP